VAIAELLCVKGLREPHVVQWKRWQVAAEGNLGLIHFSDQWCIHPSARIRYLDQHLNLNFIKPKGNDHVFFSRSHMK